MEPTTLAGTRLRTVSETAEQLHLSARMVERLIAAGDLSPLRIGRAVRISDTEIERFIRELQNDHTPADDGRVGKEGIDRARLGQ
jgi:excisionase family DNA binding protein